MKKLLFSLAIVLMVYACKKDTKTSEPTPQPAPVAPVTDVGTVKVSFNNVVDAAPLVLGNTYVSPNGDTMIINLFKYYISNVVFNKSDGSKFVEPNSYHLINHAISSSLSFTSTNVPAGTYTSVSYVIGVDSAHNVSGAQDGDLAPSKDMYWGWVTGYIMLKLEGTSPQAGSFDKTIVYHIGGYAGPTSSLRNCTIPFTQDLVVSNTKSPVLKLKTNLNELFKNPTLYGFAFDFTITSPGSRASAFATNYADMTTFEAIVP